MSPAACQPAVALLDPDAALRTALQRVLSARGIAVRDFGSPQAYLAHAAQNGHPPCLVLDVDLAGTSGLELQRRLAAEPDAPRLVFLTARRDLHAIGQAIAGGCDAYLYKPCTAAGLLSALEPILIGTSPRPH